MCWLLAITIAAKVYAATVLRIFWKNKLYILFLQADATLLRFHAKPINFLKHLRVLTFWYNLKLETSVTHCNSMLNRLHFTDCVDEIGTSSSAAYLGL